MRVLRVQLRVPLLLFVAAFWRDTESPPPSSHSLLGLVRSSFAPRLHPALHLPLFDHIASLRNQNLQQSLSASTMADGEEKKRFLEGNDMELGEKQGRFSPPKSPPAPKYTPHQTSNWQNNPILPVISYCASSIMMTVANKYILAFPNFNLNFFLLAVQVGLRASIIKRLELMIARPLSA